MIRSLALTCAIPLTLSASGCTNFYEPLDNLIGHECVAVSAPASTGAILFGTAGVPLAIALLPITVPMTDANAEFVTFAPAFVTAQVGAVLFGGLPWLVMDW
ncbi:MAG: hypothetical protein NXI31_01750 [bacterium]|nr:hypothetical protein [bacterium]